MRYDELLGKRVVTADGDTLGRIADLVVEPHGGALYVTALMIGTGAWVRRIAFRRTATLEHARPRKVPWALVARIADQVQLRVALHELTTVPDGDVLRVEPIDLSRPVGAP